MDDQVAFVLAETVSGSEKKVDLFISELTIISIQIQ